MDTLKVGVVGLGYTVGVAKRHIAAYKATEGVKITALYDIIDGRAADYAQKSSLDPSVVCSSLEQLFERVDALSITVPNYMHGDIVKKAVDHNKHFICEKPMALTHKEAQDIYNYVKNHKNKVVSLIGFNYRDIPAMRYAKSIIDSGKIGKVYTCVQQLGGSRIADPQGVMREWRMDLKQSGTGALADFGCHILDLSDFLLSGTNGKIKQVQGFKNTFIKERNRIGGGGRDPVTNEDCTVFNAITESGTLLSFHTSRIGMTNESLQIIAEGGMLVFNSGTEGKLGIQLKDKNGRYTGPMAFEDVPAEFQEGKNGKGLVLELLKCIREGAKPERDLEQGVYIQYLLDKINESMEKGTTLTI
ncbi:MAG: Gfo/Idh/MocA family oxidoreductase [Treponema sp.]|nr:Gfo/Idh/MocA family oxidoreductase [Treponema sp.]